MPIIYMLKTICFKCLPALHKVLFLLNTLKGKYWHTAQTTKCISITQEKTYIWESVIIEKFFDLCIFIVCDIALFSVLITFWFFVTKLGQRTRKLELWIVNIIAISKHKALFILICLFYKLPLGQVISLSFKIES